MPRPQLHETDAMLDAARDLLISDGARSATVDAIARASGAPTGSIYHRFGSRDELVARLWMRAVYRSQAAFLAATQKEHPIEAAVAAASSILEFCDEHPLDARLLASFRYEDLVRAVPEGALADELAELNAPVERAVGDLAHRLYGTRRRSALDRTLLCVFDLPYGSVRRHLESGRPLPRGLADDLAEAVTSILKRPL